MEVIINTTAKQNSLIYRSWGLILIMSFLFSLYYVVIENFYILIILILISLPSTLIIATTQTHTLYFKGVIFNILIAMLICLYLLYLFDERIAYGFLIYCVLDGYVTKKNWMKKSALLMINSEFNTNIINRDQFILDYEAKQGRVWQLKYHVPLMLVIFMITIPLAFLGRLFNSFFLFIPISLFFLFIFWEYTVKRFLFFHDLFKSNQVH